VHAALPAVLLAALVAVTATGTASAGAEPHKGPSGAGAGTSGAIVSPRPGQRIDTDDVLLAVKAGSDADELRARLNGVAVGTRFGVDSSGHGRHLDASLADGLRRGSNTLVVWVKQPHRGFERSEVNFAVVDKEPMAAAGVDVRTALDSPIELHGELALPKGDGTRPKVDWQIVGAPRQSDLADPSDKAAEEQALSAERTVDPTFHPDAIGTYEVKMTATGDGEATADTATIYVVPAIPMVTLDTAVPPADKDPRPGIRIGANVLRAPYLRTSGNVSDYSGTVDGVTYKAVWQIVALQRSTTKLIWNRTYGVCTTQNVGAYTCLAGQNGAPQPVDLGKELAELTDNALIVASSHPSGGAGMEWDTPDAFLYTTNNLGGIGFPGEKDKYIGYAVKAAKAGQMAGVGVPGLKAGEATVSAAGDAGLTGYLTPDSNAPPQYHFVQDQRIPFDTRSHEECDAKACTVTQKIGADGGTEVRGTVEAGKGGYLVGGFDRLTLKPIGHQVFVTAIGQKEARENPSGPAQQALEAMPKFIDKLLEEHALVLITSIHGPGQSPSILFTQDTRKWAGIEQAIVAAGGTKENFVSGALTGSGYTMVGGPYLAEGEAQETLGSHARFRGSFVPDHDSAYQPRSVNSGTTPAEMLMRIVMAPPGAQAWPDEDDPAVMNAMSAIGTETTSLGRRPRFAYWNQLATAADAARALRQVQALDEFTPGDGYDEKAFTTARQELIKELRLVESTRAYMEALAQPDARSDEIWEQAGKISAELEDELKHLKEKAKASSEYFAIIGELLEMGALFATDGASEEVKGIAKYLEAAAIAAEAGQTLFNTNFDGSEGKPSVDVEALRLGETLAEQAKDNEKAFSRFGDLIVSDWAKLQIVGRYGGCNPDGSCGKNAEYDQLALTPQMALVAEASTIRAFDRQLYGRLVPLAFPIWDTGRLNGGSERPSKGGELWCGASARYPLYGAPTLAYLESPDELFPEGNNSAAENENALVWRIHITIAREGHTYGWPGKSMLERMFGRIPLAENLHPGKGGLGMNAGDYMREGEKINKYDGVTCEG
jgi:hypothetical protein